jgi:hypothetical protein
MSSGSNGSNGSLMIRKQRKVVSLVSGHLKLNILPPSYYTFFPFKKKKETTG